MAEIYRMLVVDDDEVVRDSCTHILRRPDQIIATADNGAKGLEILGKEHFDVVILDLKMPGLPGMEIIKKISQGYPDIVIIVITGYATVDSAVEAMKLGACDFIPKPFSPESLRLIVKKAIERRPLKMENAALKSHLPLESKPDILIGKSPGIMEIKRLLQKVAPTDTTVLITGESGTGKEVIARHIHNLSNRSDKMCIAVDCGALVESLFESELFGHVKGSFTGADSTKYGRFELANGSTLFLDEIANVSLNIQAKLLRAIQEREICKVGSSQAVNIDVRIIAATSRDVKHAVQKGEFRDDLFYRLCVVWMHVPPLRERKEDIPEFVRYFINKFNERKRKNVRHISERAMQALLKYDWPGNIRELENTIERAVVLAENATIKPQDLFYYGSYIDTNNNGHNGYPVQQNDYFDGNLEEAEKDLIAKALNHYHGHKRGAAEALGIDRKTLYRKLKKYCIETE
jgi:DNA-binding NtrC family response regulator